MCNRIAVLKIIYLFGNVCYLNTIIGIQLTLQLAFEYYLVHLFHWSVLKCSFVV
jgi:hypothetical protein